MGYGQMEIFEKVTPCTPPAAYIGGKRLLARLLVERINAIPHDLYAEVFLGMGGVFLRRDHKPKVEIINDLAGDVVTLFRILQRHYPQFMDVLRFQVTSRQDFERLKEANPEALTDLERAARFLYLQRLTFGGKVAGRSFGTSRTNPARFDLTKLGPLLADVHERLSGVVIERLPWRKMIQTYDQSGVLFYLDPPYFGVEGYYGTGLFERREFEEMADVLAGIQGRFLLSLNDRPEVRTIFSAFAMEPVSLHYTANRNSDCVGRELIISKGL